MSQDSREKFGRSALVGWWVAGMRGGGGGGRRKERKDMREPDKVEV